MTAMRMKTPGLPLDTPRQRELGREIPSPPHPRSRPTVASGGQAFPKTPGNPRFPRVPPREALLSAGWRLLSPGPVGRQEDPELYKTGLTLLACGHRTMQPLHGFPDRHGDEKVKNPAQGGR